MTIFTPSNRWLLLPVLLISLFLWLGMSSVTANAVHVLAKSNFSFSRTYGSVAVWWLATALAWPLIVGYWLTTTTPVTMKNLICGACAVGLWIVILTVLAAVGEIFLDTLSRKAVITISLAMVLVEITIALWLLCVTSQPLLSDLRLQSVLVGVVAALAWLTGAKALLLCFSPGIALRI